MDKVRIKEFIDKASDEKSRVYVWGTGYVAKNNGYELLKKYGIKINYFCDNNDEVVGKDIIDGILCVSPQTIPKDAICIIMTSGHFTAEIRKQAEQYGIENILTYMELCEYVSMDYFECQRKNQIAVYTCIVGDYDEVMEPEAIMPNCDYYLISDKKKENSIYKFIDINTIKECEGLDNTRKNRYCKINAHKIFPNYRYSIYFDGNILLKKGIDKYIEDLPSTKICVMTRAGYDSVYAEAYRCMKHGRDDEDIFQKQVEKYWNEGMPEDFGLVIPSFMIRQHNSPVCKKIMNDWWNEISEYSRRDMISLSYVLWKNGYSIDDVNVAAIGTDVIDGEEWYFCRNHGKSRT